MWLNISINPADDLTLCIRETPKQVILHKGKKDLQTKEYNIFRKIKT